MDAPKPVYDRLYALVRAKDYFVLTTNVDHCFQKAGFDKRCLFWELGVGSNTPGIVKCPFWRMTAQNPKAVYACVNLTEAYAREEIRRRSIVIQEDIGTVLDRL